MALSQNAPWLAYYGNTPASLSYPDCSMYELVAQAAQKHPKTTAYIFMGRKTDYSAFLQRIDAAAKGLTAIGINKGDRVTLCMANTPQALDCFYALNRIGAIANMIHPLSAPEEIALCINMSHSKAVLTLSQFYEKVASVKNRLEAPCQIIIARIQEELPPVTKLFYPLSQTARKEKPLPAAGYILWSDLLKKGQGISLPEHQAAADDCAAILYSGGTTGTTKGILLSNRNFNCLGLQTIAASGYPDISGMKMLAVMPIFHGFGLGVGVHTPLIGGATCILVPQFSIKTYSRILRRQKPDFIPGVPTLFEALLRCKNLENVNLGFLKGIFCGGDTLSPLLKKRVDAFLKAHGCTEQIREGYGATECISASCLTPKDYAREGSIGVPFPDTFYKIVKPGTTEEVPPHREGEICICGPTVMLGYMDNPEETAQALQIHPDGKRWLHTADLGFMDEDGFVYFRQRLKRMIVSSGYNIYPSQLESILDRHEKVLQSCVVGVKDDYKGQRVHAFVVPAPGITPDDALREELLAYCRNCFAKFAMPRQIEFRTDLPKTAVGKVAYPILEAEANEKAGL